MAFITEPFKPIDVDRAAKEQYGSKAKAVAIGNHLYDWRADVAAELNSIDMKRAVKKQYGNKYKLVALGVHKYDWKAIKLSSVEYKVVPAMIIASDRFSNIAGVRTALRLFRSVLDGIQDWYHDQLEGTTFSLLAPVIVRSEHSSTWWNNKSNITAQTGHRYDLYDEAKKAYLAELGAPHNKMRVVISQYTGDSKDVWLGAAGDQDGPFVVVPPRATSVDCSGSGMSNFRCQDAMYAVGHELGHTFGLRHSCEVSATPNCSKSIMETAKPPNAILHLYEKCTLIHNPFFPAVIAMALRKALKRKCALGELVPKKRKIAATKVRKTK